MTESLYHVLGELMSLCKVLLGLKSGAEIRGQGTEIRGQGTEIRGQYIHFSIGTGKSGDSISIFPSNSGNPGTV